MTFTEEVAALLSQAGLPTADLPASDRVRLRGLREARRLVGVVGVEAHGDVGLLRSLAVLESRRRSGLGRILVAHAESCATELGIRAVYLLTAGAERFFRVLGYRVVRRSEAPAAIQATSGFREWCPSSSTLVRKVLAAGRSPRP